MKARHLAILGLTGLLAQGCARPVQAPVAAMEPADEANRAAKCEVTPNPVTIPSAAAAAPIEVAMTLGNDGGWCAVRMKQVRSAVLKTEPQHGIPYFRNVRDITRLQYTPAAGYTGTDSFSFRLLPGNAIAHVTVTVAGP